MKEVVSQASVSLPDSIKQKVAELAAAKKWSASIWMREAIEEKLEREENKNADTQ